MRELLFKSGEAGSAEIKDILGFVDADLSVDDMFGELYVATDEIVDLFTVEVYEHALSLYSQVALTESDNKSFLYRIRRAVLLNAFRAYAPTQDLAYTNNGRVMRVDEHQKSPFEWMVVRSDQQLEKMYYKALDSLYNCLDENGIAGWHTSDQYIDSQKILVPNLKSFNNIYELSSRHLYQKLIPALRIAQHSDVITRIGKAKVEELLGLQPHDIPEELEMIYTTAQEVMVYHALAWAMDRFSLTLLPDRIVQQYFSNTSTIRASKTPEGNEVAAAVQRFENDKRGACLRLEALVAPPPTEDDKDEPLYDFLFDADDNFVT